MPVHQWSRVRFPSALPDEEVCGRGEGVHIQPWQRKHAHWRNICKNAAKVYTVNLFPTVIPFTVYKQFR